MFMERDKALPFMIDSYTTGQELGVKKEDGEFSRAILQLRDGTKVLVKDITVTSPQNYRGRIAGFGEGTYKQEHNGVKADTYVEFSEINIFAY